MISISCIFFARVFMEKIFYEYLIEKNYKIEEIMFDPSIDQLQEPNTIFFHENKIKVTHTNQQPDKITGLNGNLYSYADISLQINNKSIDVLKQYGIRINEQAFNQYYGNVAFFKIFNLKTKEERFAVVLNKSKDKITRDLTGLLPVKERKFRIIYISTGGNVNIEDFSYKNRNKLQTLLAQSITPRSFGYYTNFFVEYYSIYTLPIYTFTLLIGIIVLYKQFRKIKIK